MFQGCDALDLLEIGSAQKTKQKKTANQEVAGLPPEHLTATV